MNFEQIPVSVHPAYTWLWNGHITRDGIKEQLDEMYDSGVRAFYILGEPENFRPFKRKTHLSPEYLSDEYLDLLYFAFCYAKEKGMYMWLYDEGGFPSGMVCGKIRSEHPELAKKNIDKNKIHLEVGQKYTPSESALSAFCNGKRVTAGQSFESAVDIDEYLVKDSTFSIVDSDIASPKNTELFLEMTHEKIKNRLGEHIGKDITLMFDDEAYMGSWTEGFEKIFFEQYGYDILDFLPFIMGAEPKTPEQLKAKSDYAMLCGDLVRNNFFIPVKEWLNKNVMSLTGHLDCDHKCDNCFTHRYGNTLKTLRSFDVPGIDVIWSQIDYPKNGKCVQEGMVFYPRMASSAARQLGHSKCASESFAVYGGWVTPDLMRFVVNYQAVRGISLFNFMVISYEREGNLPHQYRPNFIKENPSMDRLEQINNYTARLSYILQESSAVIDTALYYPARSICAGGELGKKAKESFERLGETLEEKGVAFDIIDEDLVKSASLSGKALICKNVSYKNIFVPECDLEQKEVIDKLSLLTHEIVPCIERENPFIQARHVLFQNGDEGYFICNNSNCTVKETIKLYSDKNIYKLDLFDGKLYSQDSIKNNGVATIDLELIRGEGIFLLLSSEQKEVALMPKTEKVCVIEEIDSYISRECIIDKEKGLINKVCAAEEFCNGLYEWNPSFSGEVTYICKLPALEKGDYILDLGEVKHTATIYLNDSKISEVTMPPYRLPIHLDGEKEITVVVANTIANACANTEFFDVSDPADVGPYHKNMILCEREESNGGLFGPVILEVKK